MLFRVLAINTIIFASAFVLPYNETLNEEAMIQELIGQLLVNYPQAVFSKQDIWY